MTAPLSDERLAEIRRSVAEVSDYVADGLMPFRREHRDRADLLAEVERLRAELGDVRADERRRCIKELRTHSKTRMDLAVAEVAAGNDGALAGVSFAATLDKASRMLESGELAASLAGSPS